MNVPPPRFSISPPIAGALIGAAAGFADWLIVANDWWHSQSGLWYLAPLASLAMIMTSVVFCAAIGIAFNSPRLGRMRAVPLAAAGLVVVLVRGAAPLGRLLGPSPRMVFLCWLALVSIVAVPLSRLPLRSTRHRFWWLAWTAVSVILLVFFAANPGVAGGRGERPRSDASRPPNVVLIFLDTTRYDDAFGPTSEMPHLAHFAAQSSSFDSAWAPAPWTVPSHYGVLTGIDPWTVPFGSRGFQREVPSLALRLRGEGYDTVAILANPLLGNPDFMPGFRSFTYSQQSGVCRSMFGTILQLANFESLHSLCGVMVASDVTSRALRYVRQSREPYFLVINYMDGHGPYFVPPDCRDRTLHMITDSDVEAFRHPGTPAPVLSAILEKGRSQHRAAVKCMDRSLGTLLDDLGTRSDTAVIVVGDHGEQFGEHGLIQHGNSLYAQLLRVPLVVRAAGFHGHISDPVSITDLYASILSIARSRFAGRSLPPLLDAHLRRSASSSFETDAAGSAAKAWSIASGQYHFIAWRDGREALYDLNSDPFETTPLSTTAGAGSVAVRALRQLVTQVATATDPRAVQFRALNYIK